MTISRRARNGAVGRAQKAEGGEHTDAVLSWDLIQGIGADIGFPVAQGKGERRNDLNARAASAGRWEYEQYQ
jgi:hypothetical protein